MQTTLSPMTHTPPRLTLIAGLCLSLGLSAPAWAQQALPPGLTPGGAQGQERLQREEQQGQERLQQGAPITPGCCPLRFRRYWATRVLMGQR